MARVPALRLRRACGGGIATECATTAFGRRGRGDLKIGTLEGARGNGENTPSRALPIGQAAPRVLRYSLSIV
jgi:hypothetical protein